MKNPSKSLRANAARFLAVLLALALLNGCTPVMSLQPLANSRMSVTEDWIEGVWEAEEESDVLWTFRSDQNEGYRLTITEKLSSTFFQVRLVRLNGQLFLDATSQRDDDSDPFVIAPHLIGRIWVQRDEIRIRMLSEDWVTTRAKNGQLEIPFTFASGKQEQVVLAASTEQLQQFVVLHAEEKDAFSVEQKLRRWK
jgi:hypothetical protein